MKIWLSSRRLFKFCDSCGSYIACCALVQNAHSSFLQEKRDVILYYVTGRRPIGNVPGMLYLTKDSWILGLGYSAEPCSLEKAVDMHAEQYDGSD